MSRRKSAKKPDGVRLNFQISDEERTMISDLQKQVGKVSMKALVMSSLRLHKCIADAQDDGDEVFLRNKDKELTKLVLL